MSSDEYKLSTLASSALFKNISEDALRRLLPHFTLKVYPTNTVIFEDGNTQPDGMYLIAKGFVKIFKSVPGEEVRQQAVAVLPAGSYFGEMALLDEEVRSAGAVTMYETELLFFPKESFHALMHEDLKLSHEIMTRLAKVMSKRLRDTNNLFREVVSWGYRARKEVRDLKSNFLSTISHELRTPIHSIQGFSTLMKESKDVDDETKQRFVEVILHESKRLADLINDLISLAEIEYGSIIIERHPNNLKELLSKAFDEYKDLAREKNINLEMKVEDTFPIVAMDGPRFIQAIGHLIENAIKFTGFGGNVGMHALMTTDAIEIHVHDTGSGIPSKYVERIFDKFYQVDQTTTRSAEGAGIGLSLARTIVELHGGKIIVTSVEGKGSTFTVTVPLSHIAFQDGR